MFNDLIKRLIGYQRDFFEKFLRWQKTTRPIFVGGMPKSGTTLVHALLDGHPEIMAFPEESIAIKLVHRPGKFSKDMNWMLREGGLSNFRVERAIWGSGTRDYSHIDFSKLSHLAKSAWSFSDHNVKTLLEISIWAYATVSGQEKKHLWAEKTPKNEQYSDQLLAQWPNAIFITVLRDSIVNFLSYRKHSIKKKREISTAGFCSDWLKTADAIEALSKKEDVNSVVVVYEDLVENPKSIMSYVAKELGVVVDNCFFQPTKAKNEWDGNSSKDHKILAIEDQNQFADTHLLDEQAKRDLAPAVERYHRLRAELSQSYPTDNGI